MCDSCDLSLKDAVLLIFNKRQQFFDFLIEHGLIAREIPCGKCDGTAKLNINLFKYRCGKTIQDSSGKKKFCSFNVSARKSTWFDKSKL